MSVYIVSYDLRKPDFDYQPLYDALDEINAKRIQDSVWGLDSSSDSKGIFDYLWQFMHSKRDRLFVVPFDGVDFRGINSINKLSGFVS